MSILANILGKSERRDYEVLVQAMEASKKDAATGVHLTPGSSLRYAAVFACVRILAETIASLPLFLYERTDGGRRRVSEHYLYPLLHDSPNEAMTALEFRETIQGHLALWGNAYAQIDYDVRGRVSALWPLNPAMMLDIKTVDGRLVYTYQLPTGEVKPLSGDVIWHLRGFSGDGMFGYSPIRLMKQGVALGLAAEEYGARFFGNDARPGIILEHPGKLGTQAMENLRKQQEDEHGGVSKSHRIQILEEGMKLHEVGIPPEDAQFLQTRRFQVEEIARIFRIPPHMLADLEKATFSNIEHQGIEFVVHTIRPWCVRWEQSISHNLLLSSERGRFYAEHLVDGLLRGDTESRYRAYATGKQWGWLSTNDIRMLENLNPIDGGEAYWMPLNMVPMSGAQIVVSDEGRGVRQREKPNPLTPFPLGPSPRGWPKGKGEEREVRQRQAAQHRYALVGRYKPKYQGTAARLLKKEGKEIMKAAEEMLASRSPSDFELWLDQFYQSFADEIIDRMLPTAMVYGEAVSADAQEEIGQEAKLTAELEDWINNYTGGYAGRHSGISMDRLRTAMQKARWEGRNVLEAVEEELDSWPETRANVIADEEVVRFNNAVAKVTYAAGGIQRIMSVAFGENCPYCDALDGKVIGINQFFIAAGEEFKPEGADAPLTSTTNLGHAPYHGGCDCMTVAG